MMKKRFFLIALSVVCAATSFAYEVGEYAYNATQRFKIMGANIVTNGNFENGLKDWYGIDRETQANDEVWSFELGGGPKDENTITSMSAAANEPLCNSWTLDPGSYIVSFDIKSPKSVYTTVITGGSAADDNACDFFLNTDGNFKKLATTNDAPVTDVAVRSYAPAEEWRNVVFFFTIEQKNQLVMHFEKLAANTQITNIEIHAAQEVYDVRKALNRIAFARELMAISEFNVEEAKAAKAELEESIGIIENMIETGEMDDPSNAESLMTLFENEEIEKFLAVTSVDLTPVIPGLNITSQEYYGRGNIGGRANKYKLDLAGNWGHLESDPDELRAAIQRNYSHNATYTAYNEDLPAGKYFFTCEIRNANTDNKSWPCNLFYNVTKDENIVCRMFIGEDTVDVGPIYGEDYQRFSMMADVPQGVSVRAGIYWPGLSVAGAFLIRNTMFRSFNLNTIDAVEHNAAFKTYMTQWNATIESRTTMMEKMDNPNYPWGQKELKAERDRLDPYYTSQLNKGWSTADGTDAGIASTEELLDWANYQGFEEYTDPADGTDPTRKTYLLVRGYQAANNAIIAINKVITDLAEAIDAAKKTRNKGANLTGDRDTYKSAILTALEILKTTRANTTDATREADSTAIAQAKEALDAATAVFLASVGVKPFIDIDFSKGATENTDEAYTEVYYCEGEKGRMYFSVFSPENSGNSYFTLGSGTEYMDMLRVGNGKATVYIDETDQPGSDDCLRITFDMYHGKLNGKSAGVELQNAEGKRVAGFSINSYHGLVSYNDFNDVLTEGGEGMNILKYASSASSNIANEANKTSYDLVIDYHNSTLQGSMNNPQKGSCEGKPMPFRTGIEDYKVAKFVLFSNYGNEGRRCWFDNLKISKYPLTDVEEDITESPWADVTGIKSVVGNASHTNAVYNLQGQKVKVAAKGLYIMNGRKVLVK